MQEEGTGIVIRKPLAGELVEKPRKPEVAIEVIRKFTEEELFKQNDSQQKFLIRKYDKTIKIPTHEKDRIAVILELQKNK